MRTHTNTRQNSTSGHILQKGEMNPEETVFIRFLGLKYFISSSMQYGQTMSILGYFDMTDDSQ